MAETTKLHAPTRFESLRVQMLEMASRLGPGTKLPRLNDLGRELGTSAATITRVLNELEGEGVFVRRKAVGVFVGESVRPIEKRVAIVCEPNLFRGAQHSPFWDLLLDAAQVKDEGDWKIECHFHHAGDGVEGLPLGLREQIERGRVDGVIGVALEHEAAQWIMAQRVPVVNLYGGGHCVVNTDGEALVREGLRFLRARGHRKIEIWRPRHPEYEDKEAANFAEIVQNASAASGFDAKNLTVRVWAATPSPMTSAPMTSGEQGFALAEAFLARRGAWPDALFFSEDVLARGALTRLEKAGVKAGRDLEILSHANTGSDVLLGWQNEVSRVEFDPALIAAALFELLEKTMTAWENAGEIRLIAPRLVPASVVPASSTPA